MNGEYVTNHNIPATDEAVLAKNKKKRMSLPFVEAS
jgi:hypothetical protein